MGVVSQSQYRLIWFHHFEKTAGSTVVRLARANGERFYSHESNGIPRDDDGGFLPLWDYAPKELLTFIDRCERSKTTFVSSSFGAPDFSALAGDERVWLATTLRDPITRFVSAFRYEYMRGGSHRDIRTFRTSAAATLYGFHKLDNYYCRALSRNWLSEVLPVDAYLAAKGNLRLFDVAATIETKSWSEQLCHSLGWTHMDLKVNTSSMSLRKAFSLLRSRHFGLLTRQLFQGPLAPESAFLERLNDDNHLDRALYNDARAVFEGRRSVDVLEQYSVDAAC